MMLLQKPPKIASTGPHTADFSKYIAYSDVFGILIRSPCMPASDDSGSALMACRFMRGSALTGGSTRVFSTPGDHASNVSSEQRFSMKAFVMGRTLNEQISVG